MSMKNSFSFIFLHIVANKDYYLQIACVCVQQIWNFGCGRRWCSIFFSLQLPDCGVWSVQVYIVRVNVEILQLQIKNNYQSQLAQY